MNSWKGADDPAVYLCLADADGQPIPGLDHDYRPIFPYADTLLRACVWCEGVACNATGAEYGCILVHNHAGPHKAATGGTWTRGTGAMAR